MVVNWIKCLSILRRIEARIPDPPPVTLAVDATWFVTIPDPMKPFVIRWHSRFQGRGSRTSLLAAMGCPCHYTCTSSLSQKSVLAPKLWLFLLSTPSWKLEMYSSWKVRFCLSIHADFLKYFQPWYSRNFSSICSLNLNTVDNSFTYYLWSTVQPNTLEWGERKSNSYTCSWITWTWTIFRPERGILSI